MEISNLDVKLSENVLVSKIKSDEQFHDDKNKFSRTKYEKFLLSNNYTAPSFEKKLKNNELEKNLFEYISGGVRTPFFITKLTFFTASMSPLESLKILFTFFKLIILFLIFFNYFVKTNFTFIRRKACF